MNVDKWAGVALLTAWVLICVWLAGERSIRRSRRLLDPGVQCPCRACDDVYAVKR